MTDFLRGIEHRHGITAEIDSAKHPNQWFYDTTLTRMGLYESDGTTIHYVLTTDNNFIVNESIVHFRNIPGGDLGADFILRLESNDFTEIQLIADSDGTGGGGGPHTLRMLLTRDGEFKLLESPSGNVCMLLDITTCRLGVGKGIVLPDATLQIAEPSGTTAILTLETLGVTNDCIFNIENATQQWQFDLDGNSSFGNAHALVLRDITGALNDVMVWERATGRVGVNQNNPRTLFDVNGEASAQIISKGHLNLLGLVFNTTSTVDIAVGNCRNSTDVFNINVTGTLTADITASGANGLDTGAEAADTWYAVFVIGDTTGVNAPASLLSLSPTAPTLPGTHNIFRRVGWVRNNGSSNFIEFRQVWNGLTRRYWWDDIEPNLRVLTGGTATIFTAVDCSNLAPPTSHAVNLSIFFRTSSAGAASSGDHAIIKPTGSTNDGVRILGPGFKSNSNTTWIIEMDCDDSQSIDYRNDVSNNVTNIHVLGFDDEL